MAQADPGVVAFGDPRLSERFWAGVKVCPDSGCWNSVLGLERDGYSRRRVGGKRRPSHRITYEDLVGPVPVGLQLDHFACDNRACCNPAHVRPVTARENQLRGNGVGAVGASKTHCPQGHPYSGDNLYINPRGSRCCRECMRASDRRVYWKKKHG